MLALLLVAAIPCISCPVQAETLGEDERQVRFGAQQELIHSVDVRRLLVEAELRAALEAGVVNGRIPEGRVAGHPAIKEGLRFEYAQR